MRVLGGPLIQKVGISHHRHKFNAWHCPGIDLVKKQGHSFWLASFLILQVYTALIHQMMTLSQLEQSHFPPSLFRHFSLY
jgi:hypothetical protein